jgi:hypothetical protein
MKAIALAEHELSRAALQQEAQRLLDEWLVPLDFRRRRSGWGASARRDVSWGWVGLRCTIGRSWELPPVTFHVPVFDARWNELKATVGLPVPTDDELLTHQFTGEEALGDGLQPTVAPRVGSVTELRAVFSHWRSTLGERVLSSVLGWENRTHFIQVLVRSALCYPTDPHRLPWDWALLSVMAREVALHAEAAKLDAIARTRCADFAGEAYYEWHLAIVARVLSAPA